MKKKAFQKIEVSRLGMGNMRLPSVDAKDSKAPIDYPEAIKLIRRAYEEGINYLIPPMSTTTEIRKNVWEKQ